MRMLMIGLVCLFFCCGSSSAASAPAQLASQSSQSGLDVGSRVASAVGESGASERQLQSGPEPLKPDSEVESEPEPNLEPLVRLWKDRLRVDPTILLITGRLTFDSKPDTMMEIDPFRDGTVDADVQLAGIDVSHDPWQNKWKLGANFGVGVTEYENAGLALFSIAGFVELQTLYRIEFGWMRAVSRKDGLDGDDADKTAGFVGVSFPGISEKIREWLAK